MKSWVQGPSEASSQVLGPVLDLSDLPPAQDIPHTRPPAQGVLVLYARLVVRPSQSSGGRYVFGQSVKCQYNIFQFIEKDKVHVCNQSLFFS